MQDVVQTKILSIVIDFNPYFWMPVYPYYKQILLDIFLHRLSFRKVRKSQGGSFFI